MVAAGSGRRPNELKWGHFAASRWHVAGDSRPEVLIGGEGLRRPPIQVFGTLLHEAAHGIASARGARDTSRQGRYHNSVFRQLAIEVGLEVARDGSRGWSRTEVPAATAARYRPALADLSGALVLWRRAEHGIAGGSRVAEPRRLQLWVRPADPSVGADAGAGADRVRALARRVPPRRLTRTGQPSAGNPFTLSQPLIDFTR